jgi:luciferase family oxidoreductase group 1
MTAISVLDLMMIGQDKTFTDTLSDAVKLARHVEAAGYRRFWIAEHHDLPGIASAATALLVQHVASATASIRVGAGGIMIPNHAPLVVAENFATLETLFPGRIDLGIGRAAGSGAPAIRALRGDASPRDIHEDLTELGDYLSDNGRQPVRAIPGNHSVPLCILGSSTHSAVLAGNLGLPYAFASHFAPAMLLDALRLYREHFRPSAALAKPYTIAGANLFLADTREEASLIASSHVQWVARLHEGRPGPLPLPSPGVTEILLGRRDVAEAMACTAFGTVSDVRGALGRFIETTGVDEIVVDARIHDVEARCRSYALAAEAIASL